MSKEQNPKLTEIKTAMLLHVPFFASLLLDMMEIKVGKFEGIWPKGQETAATNGKVIFIDEDFLKKMPLPEAVFVVCHEVGHAMWQHMSRGKKYYDLGFDGTKFDPRLWNIAGDYVINDLLVQSKVGKMPSVGLHDSNRFPSTMLVDDVYRELMKDPPSPDQDSMDLHILDPGSANANEWKRAVKSAADAAKAMGKLPDNLKRFVDQLLNPKVPWQEKLRSHVVRAIGRDAHTWSRPHKRRLINQGIVLPSYTGFGAGHVVVAIDTSGSIGQKELTAFMSELQSILDTAKPKRTTVLAIDAAVHDITELESGDSLVDNMPGLGGGGGTSFRPAFDWCETEGIEPGALIYFTDMMGDFPDHAPAYPVIWCATTQSKAPWGELIEIELNDYAKDGDSDDDK